MTTPLSRASSRIKDARRLTRRRDRVERGLFLAEGDNALRAGLEHGHVVEVFATCEATTRRHDLYADTVAAGAAWHLADEAAVGSLSDAVTPSGVVAVCRAVDVGLADLVDRAAPPLVVCADVRDPGNAGTVVRTADAAGAGGVVLTGHSVDPYNPKTVRATAGSLFHLPLAVEPDPAAVIDAVRGAGMTVLAADGAGETDLFEADALLARPVAWLFGNEAWGLPEELAGLADHRVRIPIAGGAESLNLSTAAAVCLYAGARVRAGR